MLHPTEAGQLDLALHLGLADGKRWGEALLKPACTVRRPRNPYWCPIRNFAWRLGFSLGCYDAVNGFNSGLHSR